MRWAVPRWRQGCLLEEEDRLDGAINRERVSVKVLRAIRRATAVSIAIAVLLSAAGCGVNASAICEGAGGTYVGGTCSRWGPRQREAEQMCESRGGVYLRGAESCAFGEGGP
jgi:hypothetical protein